jgi:hypothetical protein
MPVTDHGLAFYRIRWTASKAGATGHGTASWPYSEARRYCDELNAEHIGVVHHVPEALSCLGKTIKEEANMTEPTRVNPSIHAPEGTTFKAEFRPSWGGGGGEIFELTIGICHTTIYVHSSDLRRFANTVQLALDQLGLPHGEPSAAIAEAITKDGSTDDGG